MIFRRICRAAFALIVFSSLVATGARAMPFHDVFIMLDNSGSLTQVNFDAQQQAAINMVNDYGRNPNNPMRFSIIDFATNATPVHGFGDSQAVPDVVAALSGLTHTGGWTNTDDALSEILAQLDAELPNGNTTSVVLFTDGIPLGPQGAEDVCHHRPTILTRGIDLHVVGHGSGWVNNNGQARMDCLVTDMSNNLSKPAPLQYDIADYEFLSTTTILAMVEPGTLAVLGLGLVAIGYSRRRTA